MISMYTKQEIIIRRYREGKSYRGISRELGISRTTVKKYFEEYEMALRTNSNASKVQSEYLSSAPSYKTLNRSKFKLTREVQEIIDKFLEANKQKQQQGLGKQILKKCDILNELHQRGIEIGYTTVCNYIRQKTNTSSSSEAFIRQTYLPSEECEFDWGEVKINIKGKQVKLNMAVFTSSFSNYRYAILFQRQDTLAFMESHVSFFKHIGGAYHKMVYDNMRVAVSKFIGPHEKEPTQALLQLRGHYGFTHRFCNAYRGNEKGHVERSVEYIRRKAFGITSSFEDIDKAQEHLLNSIKKLNSTKQQLTGKTANELFSQEKNKLYQFDSDMTCSEQEQSRVDKYSTISYKTNRYSVPDKLVGNFVEVRIQSHKIVIYYQGQQVASHERSYGKHQWSVSIEHYLSTFKQKPGALKGSLALALNEYLKSLYNQYFQESPREFVDFIEYCYTKEITTENIKNSINKLLNNNIKEITTDKIKALLGNEKNEFKQNICSQTSQMAKEQLSKITALFN